MNLNAHHAEEEFKMTATETITVNSLNKFGVRVGNKQYNFSKNLVNKDLKEGNTYEVEVFTSANGAKYINSASSALAAKEPIQMPSNLPGVATLVEVQKKLNGHRDYDAEARGKVACAAYTAALVPAVSISTVDNLEENIHKLAKIVIDATWKAQKGE